MTQIKTSPPSVTVLQPLSVHTWTRVNSNWQLATAKAEGQLLAQATPTPKPRPTSMATPRLTTKDTKRHEGRNPPFAKSAKSGAPIFQWLGKVGMGGHSRITLMLPDLVSAKSALRVKPGSMR